MYQLNQWYNWISRFATSTIGAWVVATLRAASA